MLSLERKYLITSTAANLLVGVLGLTVAVVSSSQAIFLDGLFNLTYFATGLFTVKVASLVAGGDDERFPHGYAFFEPLVNGIKGMLVLGVSIMALLGARRWGNTWSMYIRPKAVEASRGNSLGRLSIVIISMACT